MRCLQLNHLPATAAASKLFKSALEGRRWSLEELDLQLLINNRKNDPSQFLMTIDDGLFVLKRLTLGLTSSLMPSPVRYLFRNLSELTRLSVGVYIHADTVRSLVRCSAATLGEVECHKGRALQALLAETNTVHTVKLDCRAVVRGVSGLRQLGTLRLLQVDPDKPARYVAALLRSAPPVPREVHLKLHLEQLRYFSAVASSRITSLVVWGSRWGVKAKGTDKTPALPPFAFPDLERLLVLECRRDNAEWRLLKAAWSDASAPCLRELHLHDYSCYASTGSPDADWASQLMARRPGLRVCLSARRCWRWRSPYD